MLVYNGESQVKPHENIRAGVCLSLLGGFLDAYSYLLKGGVFANAQTGNLVLLFLSFAGNQLQKSVKYSIPIAAFAAGVLLSELLKSKKLMKEHTRVRVILLVESIVIVGIAFVGKYCHDCFVNSVISFLAAIQAASFERVNGNPVATTMITGDLKSGMIALSGYIQTKNNAYKNTFINYFVIIFSFGIGVVVGSVAIHFFAEYAILFCLIFTSFVFLSAKTQPQ